MVDRPTKAFTLAHANRKQDKPQDRSSETIRDKDNAEPRPTPPAQARYPRLNLAAPGMSGIKRHLPTPQHHDAKSPMKEAGDLTREFKPIARGKDGNRGHDR